MVMCDVRCAMCCVPVPCCSQLCNGRARASGFGAGGEEVNDDVVWQDDSVMV
jgi:hypothetical protein